jgi:hypothetical protein
MIGIASHLGPKLPGTCGDKFRVQASSVGILLGFLSKRDLHFFKE